MTLARRRQRLVALTGATDHRADACVRPKERCQGKGKDAPGGESSGVLGEKGMVAIQEVVPVAAVKKRLGKKGMVSRRR